MTYALVFPGQGTQHGAMLPWLSRCEESAPLLQSLDEMLGADWRVRVDDAAWATRNAVAQPLVTGVSLAAWAALAPHLGPPAFVAGYSVGELAAWGAAGLFDARNALAAAAARAAFMDEAGGTGEAAMLSVAGVPIDELQGFALQHRLHVAIRIDVGQAVLGGAPQDVDAATPLLQERGARLLRLGVRIASHTPAMQGAAQAFARWLEARPTPASATCGVICGIDGGARRDAPSLRAALVRQIDHPVRWDLCMQALQERRVRCVLEVGPGRSLTRLWSTRNAHIPARSVDDFQTREAVLEWVRRMVDAAD